MTSAISDELLQGIIDRELETAKTACIEWQRYRDALVFLAANGRWPTDTDD